jgi:hypothetical protein
VSGGGSRAGKVRVFDLVGASWTQVGGDVLGATGLNGEQLGETLALSDDGTRFATTGSPQNLGKVYSLAGGAWVQVGANITSVPGSAARPEGIALQRTAARSPWASSTDRRGGFGSSASPPDSG